MPTSPTARDGDFSYDYHVTLDATRAPVEYNDKGRTRRPRGPRVASLPACRWRGSDHADPNGGPAPAVLATWYPVAGVAEWQGTGLQSRLRGFESRHSLNV